MNRLTASRLVAATGVAVLLVTGCTTKPQVVCGTYSCEMPAYAPDTATQIENHLVAVLSAIGVVPIIPRSANGPARRTVGH